MTLTLAGISGGAPVASSLTIAGISGGTGATDPTTVTLYRKGTASPVSLYRKGSPIPASLHRKGAPAPAAGRNRYLQPFSATSIWNRPLGSSATYATLASLATAAGVTWHAPLQGHSVDEAFLVLDPTATVQPLWERGEWYHETSPAAPTDTGISVRWGNLAVPYPNPGEYPNNMAAALLPANPNRAMEFQYVTTNRSGQAADGKIYAHEHIPRAQYDLDGDGLTQGVVCPATGWMFGSHGGSGLCSTGGTIRGGELTTPGALKHALSVTINMHKWGDPSGSGYQWPATIADNGYATNYGSKTSTGGHALTGVRMGTLLAIPPAVTAASLNVTSTIAANLLNALQGWGAYVVDTSVDPATGSWDTWLWNLDSVAKSEAIITATIKSELDRIVEALAVVTNNATGGTCSGGGTPIRSVAADLAPL